MLVLRTAVLAGLVGLIVCPPVTPPKAEEEKPEAKKDDEEVQLGLEYERYLKEVVSVLETDHDFRKKLEDSNISDIKSGDIANHLDFVSHNVRTKLDEIKRREVNRLGQLRKLMAQREQGVRPGMDHETLTGHIDHKNPETFEVDDLKKLIVKATTDLEVIDKERKSEFKKYEMEKEHLRREKLKAMDEQQRKEEQAHFDEMKKKHGEHPKVNHPGNKKQLEEVWEEDDGMDSNDFDPKTFFYMHDTDGNGVLDESEVEALFQRELDKVYDPDAPEDDMMERYEEMNRMREHVVNEVDKNGDKLITLQEFIDSTLSEQFNNDEEWDTLDEEEQYTDEELAEFERQYEEAERRRMFEGHQQPGEVNVPPMEQQMQQQQMGVQHMQQQQGQQQQVHPAMLHKPQYQQQQQQQHQQPPNLQFNPSAKLPHPPMQMQQARMQQQQQGFQQQGGFQGQGQFGNQGFQGQGQHTQGQFQGQAHPGQFQGQHPSQGQFQGQVPPQGQFQGQHPSQGQFQGQGQQPQGNVKAGRMPQQPLMNQGQNQAQNQGQQGQGQVKGSAPDIKVPSQHLNEAKGDNTAAKPDGQPGAEQPPHQEQQKQEQQQQKDLHGDKGETNKIAQDEDLPKY